MYWREHIGVTDSNRHVLASCTLNDIQVWAEEFIGPNSQVSVVWQSEDKRTC